MKSLVINHIVNDLGKDPIVAEKLFNTLSGHQDILEEFVNWLETGEFKSIDGTCINVAGYTAEKLRNETYLTPLGAYNYLIFLREEPELAIDYLKKGLPIE